MFLKAPCVNSPGTWYPLPLIRPSIKVSPQISQRPSSGPINNTHLGVTDFCACTCTNVLFHWLCEFCFVIPFYYRLENVSDCKMIMHRTVFNLQILCPPTLLLLSILKHFLNSAICTSCKGEIWQRWIIKPHYKTSCYHQLFLTPPKKIQTCTLFASSPKQVECKDLLTPGILQIHNMHLFSRLWITTCHLRENKCKILTCSTNWCQNDHIWCPFLSSL